MRTTSLSGAAVALLCAVTAYASPPLGLTQVSPAPASRSKLAVVDGVAYVSNSLGVTPVDDTGRLPVVEAPDGVFHGPISATRVVKGGDGRLYLGVNYESGGEYLNGGSILFQLSSGAMAPVASWDGLDAIGFGSDLRGIGCRRGACLGYFSNRRLLPDGTETLLPGEWFKVVEVTPSGLAIGIANIPGTLGAAVASLSVDDEVSFLTDHGDVLNARERLDGGGVNFVWDGGLGATVYYAERGPYTIGRSFDYTALVSESDFVVGYETIQNAVVFYPGVNPSGSNATVPLRDYFPDLRTLNFDEVTDIAPADGKIYLLFSGSDGLWLYTAVDPTVVPEPTSCAILLVSLALSCSPARVR